MQMRRVALASQRTVTRTWVAKPFCAARHGNGALVMLALQVLGGTSSASADKEGDMGGKIMMPMACRSGTQASGA